MCVHACLGEQVCPSVCTTKGRWKPHLWSRRAAEAAETAWLAHCCEGLPFRGQKVEGSRTSHTGEAGTSVYGTKCCPIICTVSRPASRGRRACVRACVRALGHSHCPAPPGGTGRRSHKDSDFPPSLPEQDHTSSRSDASLTFQRGFLLRLVCL